MDSRQLTVFFNELEKHSESRFSNLWDRFTSLSSSDHRSKNQVKSHFSSKSGKEKWKKFSSRARDKAFIRQLAKHPDADEKLIRHAEGLRMLARGNTIDKIRSSGGGGKTYEIKKTTKGYLACTCNDWHFKGSISPGYECKHIRAHRDGKIKASMDRSPFSQQMSGFFDELTGIINRKQADREEAMDKRDSRPYSSLLTQDEEPAEQYDTRTVEEEEPEVITRQPL